MRLAKFSLVFIKTIELQAIPEVYNKQKGEFLIILKGDDMQTRQFRIGELSKKLSVEKFVIRFWEKEFNIKPQRSTGQQRFYTEKDFQKFTAIKDLLYHKGFTIAGAKKQLGSTSNHAMLSATKTTLAESSPAKTPLHENLINLRTQLIKIRKLL